MPSPPLWKASVALTKAEAADVAAALELGADAQAVLIVEEPFADGAVVEALFTEAPDAAYLARITGRAITVAPLPDQDWIKLSQEGLPPVRAGRFFVATHEHAARRRAGETALTIDAGLAFGTGQHATTAGCLQALDALARRHRFTNILDVGTGTGVLAFAAARTWRSARVTASDIDVVAVEVARANARINGIRAGSGSGSVDFIAAPGLGSRRIAGRAPYDLIIANILAAPLIDLAGDISRALAPGGFVILAGLLDSQATQVGAAYAARKLRRVATSGGEWPTLVLRR